MSKIPWCKALLWQKSIDDCSALSGQEWVKYIRENNHAYTRKNTRRVQFQTRTQIQITSLKQKHYFFHFLALREFSSFYYRDNSFGFKSFPDGIKKYNI